MPIVITEIQNQRLIGKATIEKVTEKSIIGERKIETISALNRIKTIVRAETETSLCSLDREKTKKWALKVCRRTSGKN